MPGTMLLKRSAGMASFTDIWLKPLDRDGDIRPLRASHSPAAASVIAHPTERREATKMPRTTEESSVPEQ
jgi:hypothetical protein